MRQANHSFQELYETLHDKMLRVAYRMVGNIETAEDLVQDAFLLALFQKDKLVHHPSVEGWLMRVLQNLALNERRRMKLHPEIPLTFLQDMANNLQSSSIDDILPKQLSKQEREILRWRFEENMDYDKIADRLGISAVGCRSRVFRAIKRCKELLQQP